MFILVMLDFTDERAVGYVERLTSGEQGAMSFGWFYPPEFNHGTAASHPKQYLLFHGIPYNQDTPFWRVHFIDEEECLVNLIVYGSPKNGWENELDENTRKAMPEGIIKHLASMVNQIKGSGI